MIRRQHHNKVLKRAAFYVRRSQFKPLGEIQALQAQIDRFAAYCLEHGYIMPHNQRYTEVQAGSVDSDRPALLRLGEAVRYGCIAIMVVSSLDRFTRDSTQSAHLVEEFKVAGVTIATAGA